MSLRFRLLVLSAAFVSLVAGGLPTADPAAAAAVSPDDETALVLMVDAARGAHGRAPLRVCADLRDVARSWSDRLAAEGRLRHNPGLEQAVAGWRSLSENVGYDLSVGRVHDAFMASAPHREHVVDPRLTEVGVGVVHHDGRVWVTQVFREPDGSRPCAIVPLDERITTACPHGRVAVTSFPDTRGNAHREAIDCLLWYDLAQGTDAAHYSPSAPVNRAQAATFIARLIERAGGALPSPTDQGFTDLGGSPHADAINQLVELGIVHGQSPTVYAPDRAVTRAQLATFLVAAYEHASGERLTSSRDHFADDDGQVHEEAINQAAGAGFLAGLADGRYAPNLQVPRAQFASALGRALDRLVTRGQLRHPG